ncbi:MAG: hypothetical protein II610_09255 [Treponema sp.]|nr:hypothetical protein [Treponema sp.]
MNKLIFCLVGLVVILASCSNSAGNPALGTVPTAAPTQTETTVTTTQYPKKSTVYQEDNAGTYKVDFTDKVNLTGYHEIPKDSEYGINWVYISKSTIEKSLTEVDPAIKYLPIRWFEYNYSNVLGYRLSCESKTSDNCESFYKCIPYVKNGLDYRAFANSESVWVLNSQKTEKIGTAGIGYRIYPKTESSDERTEQSGGDFNCEKYFPEWKYLER